jgi:response regulator of citrate/malate metabolism
LGLLSLITVVLDDQQSVLASVHQLQDQRGALDGGAADYLIKPFEFPQLLAKLEAFAARADALASATGADQTLIDSLFGSPRGSSGHTREDPLPKGPGAVTGQLVLDAVRAAGEVSSTECTALAGISRVSARRYLEHFLSVGALELRVQYGAGRPERRYRGSSAQ